MKRLIAVIAVLTAAVVMSASSPAIAVSTCSDSWGSDGHNGPWFTTSNDALHGNTVDVSCPGSGTAWKVEYYVWVSWSNNLADPIAVTRSGNGSTSFSVSLNPWACPSPSVAWTQVHNDYTGGNISKPSTHDHPLC